MQWKYSNTFKLYIKIVSVVLADLIHKGCILAFNQQNGTERRHLNGAINRLYFPSCTFKCLCFFGGWGWPGLVFCEIYPVHSSLEVRWFITDVMLPVNVPNAAVEKKQSLDHFTASFKPHLIWSGCRLLILSCMTFWQAPTEKTNT